MPMTRMDWDRVKRDKLVSQTTKPKFKPDRITNLVLSGGAGRKAFGACPKCSGCTWFDNRPAIKSGRYKPNAPVAKCKACGYVIWSPKKPTPRWGSAKTLPPSRSG